MFKVKIYNNDPSMMNIIVYRTYYCTMDNCKCANTCPYEKPHHSKAYFKFLKNLFHINIIVTSYCTNLSGTRVCPNHFDRAKQCWNCDYSYNLDRCSCSQRSQDIQSGKDTVESVYDTLYPTDSICRYFKPIEWFDDYDKNVKI